MVHLLISPRLAVQKGDFLGSGVPYWPLELAILANLMRERGDEVEFFDLFGLQPNTLEDAGSYFLQGLSINNANVIKRPDLITIYAISYMSHQEIQNICLYLKVKFPKIPICILENSQAVTAYAIDHVSDALFNSGANFLLLGEVFSSWQSITDYILGNTTTRPKNVMENTISDGFELNRNYQKLEKYPMPAWDLVPYNNYWKLKYSHGPKAKKYFPILTSRGCPYPCSFCVVPTTNDRKFRPRSASDVVDEMEEIFNRYSVNYFQVEDLNPTVQTKRWVEISQLLLFRNLDIKFAFISGTKAETIRVEDVPLLARAGLEYVSISPESGSSRIMKEIGKPFDYEHGKSLIRACYESGIFTQACFLVGYPGETNEDFLESKTYLKDLIKLGLDEVAIFIVSPFAGSQLFKDQKINLADSSGIVSFSPTGRLDYELIEKRRSELIKIFFIEKLKKGLPIWIQGLRALFGTPKTKMENLPLRIVQVTWFRIRRLFLQLKSKLLFL